MSPLRSRNAARLPPPSRYWELLPLLHLLQVRIHARPTYTYTPGPSSPTPSVLLPNYSSL